MTTLPSNQRGTSLVEMLMTIAIFAMVTTSLYTLIWLALHLLRDDQARLDAIAIAQSRIEELRNAPYESVGTSGGIPSGAFLQSETVERNSRDYFIETEVIYVDDSYDELAPTDTVNTDYKQAEVRITWEGQYVAEPVVLSTYFAPEGMETSAGGGTLWIETVDAAGSPVVGANVVVTNPTTTPTVSVVSTTDVNGRYILPGAPAATQSYHVEVTKPGYSSAQTYPEDLENNPNPDPQDLSVIASDTTTLVSVIDILSTLNIHLERRDDSTAIIQTEVQMIGTHRIGTDLSGTDIPKYSATHTSNDSGDIALTGLEFDNYTLTLDEATGGFDIAGFNQPLPLAIGPNTSNSLTLRLADAADHTALLTVSDSAGVPVANASIHLFNSDSSIDLTATSDADGQVFFSPLTADAVTVEVTATDFALYTTTLEISGDVRASLPLTAV